MSTANELLRMLGSGTDNVGAASRVRPSSAGSQGTAIDGASFGDLLAQAERGELSSGMEVSIDADAGVELSGAELAELSKAADRAESEGVRRALVLSGDKAMILDVATRTVVGEAEVKDGVVAGIDGVIRLGAQGKDAEPELLRVPHGNAAAHPSLADILASRDRSAQG